ncbi:hypothetical protein V1292_005117 [Bradyrhizobium sp. AZCC 1719]|uniref:hypothetical protein n=1 Tax=Bradyrhizobium sp. AZCC 1719 TaxID=3117028 RepID=UPI002FEEC6BA
MSGRGGAGRGQGRKPATPNFLQRIAIGSMCENLRRDRAEQTALERAEAEPYREIIRDLQEKFWTERKARYDKIQALKKQGAGRIELTRAVQEFKKWETAQFRKFDEKVKPELDTKGRRLISLAKYRPRNITRSQVCHDVAKECAALGWGRISPRKVNDYWGEYIAFEKMRKTQKV